MQAILIKTLCASCLQDISLQMLCVMNANRAGIFPLTCPLEDAEAAARHQRLSELSLCCKDPLAELH